MSTLRNPVHEEKVSNATVRFFSSPTYLQSGRPDMPWHSCDDLWQALDIDENGRTFFLRSLRADWWDPQTVATQSGPVVIAPYLMGDILIDEWIAHQRAPWQTADDDGIELLRLRGSFRRGNSTALKATTPHLNDIGKMVFALEAMKAMDEFRSKWDQ